MGTGKGDTQQQTLRYGMATGLGSTCSTLIRNLHEVLHPARERQHPATLRWGNASEGFRGMDGGLPHNYGVAVKVHILERLLNDSANLLDRRVEPAAHTCAAEQARQCLPSEPKACNLVFG